MKLSRGMSHSARVACLLACLALAVPTSAQDTAARLIASLTAITNGDDAAARREAIVTSLRSRGVEPMIEPFGQGRGAGSNIVVTLPAADTRTIVLGAHYDRVSVGRGAVDNGASCAALIELVDAFKRSPLERTTVHVVFFDREETGLQGSRAFFAAGRRFDYAVNMDIFAYGDTIFATTSKPDGLLIRSLKTAGEATRLPIRDVARDQYPSSDHLTMMAAGIETLAVALIDMADIEGVLAMGPKLAIGRGPRILRIIHTPDDTLAQVRPEQMSRGIALVEQLIRTVDRAS